MTPEEHLLAAWSGLGLELEAETAPRVAELLRGFVPGPRPVLSSFPAPSQDVVALRGLPFHSLCEHHLLPFFGTVDLAYRPGARILGLGGVPRLLDWLARRPTLQERLATELADAILLEVEAHAVRVRVRARHLCMEMRGARSPGEVCSLVVRGAGDEGLRDALS